MTNNIRRLISDTGVEPTLSLHFSRSVLPYSTNANKCHTEISKTKLSCDLHINILFLSLYALITITSDTDKCNAKINARYVSKYKNIWSWKTFSLVDYIANIFVTYAYPGWHFTIGQRSEMTIPNNKSHSLFFLPAGHFQGKMTRFSPVNVG